MNEIFGKNIVKTRFKKGFGRSLINVAESCFARVLKLLPCRYRFEAAIIIAHIAVPFFRLTAAYKQQLTTKVDGPCEITLHFILNALTKNGTKFDPVIEILGYENFERAHAAQQGVLVTGPHAALNLLFVRVFHEKGLQPIVVSPDSQMHIGGTTVIVRTIQPSPTFLVKTRNSLRNGNVVCAMPDRAEHHGTRTIEFETINGSVIFAPALLQVAEKCGSRIIFTEVHLEGRKIVGKIVEPSITTAAPVDFLTQEFIKFVQCHVEDRFSNPTKKKGKESGKITASTHS